MNMLGFIRKKNRIFLFLALIVLGQIISSTLISTPAHAQRKHISAQERAIMTFYRLSGLKPDFPSWVKADKTYKKLHGTNQSAAQDYMAEELLRLQWGIGTLDLPKNFVSIDTQVQATLIENDGKFYLGLDFPGKRGFAPYFPYTIADIWVALILHDIEKFMLVELTPEQHARLLGYLPQGLNDKTLKVKIVYRAVSAQKKPIRLDGMNQHIMLGEIARWDVYLADFHQSQDKIIWDYVAPWYMSESENDLLKILSGEQ